MTKRNWARHLPSLGISACFLFGSSVVYGDMHSISMPSPQMNLTQDNFNTELKLNLSIYNPALGLTANGHFTQAMGFYVYSNYPTKIAHYQISIYRASDKDNLTPLKVIGFSEISPYEAILWDGTCDNGQTLAINTDYKAILTVKGVNGRQDVTRAMGFSTSGYGEAQDSEFDAYLPVGEQGLGKSSPLSANEKSYISEREENGRLIQVVDLSKLAAMSQEEQDRFWEKALVIRSSKGNYESTDKPASVPAVESHETDDVDEVLLRGRLKESNEIPGFGLSQLDSQGIVAPAQDRKVVVQLSGLAGMERVMLNNESLVVDSQGRAMREVVLSPGEYAFNLSWTDEDGVTHQQQETLVIEKQNDVFFVALVEVTYAQNNVSGAGKSILQDADEHHYSGKGSWDGRVAFYLKGNYDDIRVTAHLDTTETRLADAFGRMGDKDPTRFARELDPQAYYPIYGDDSTVERDVDTQGKFYVKLEKGKSYALWGNFNTQMTGTAFSDFNRSLYGAKLYHESENTTKFGDTKSYLTLFGSTGETRGSHNEFTSTGGSLYYLKHQRVTEGSLKLSVEIRDANTGRVISIESLSEGTDYEIDNFQGRILLTKPLPMTASGGSGSSIISGGSLLSGDAVWLIAEYEYYSDGMDMEGQKVYGVRGYGWLNDHIRLGGSYVREDQAGGDAYELQGLDVTLRPLKGTHTQIEYAMSDASNSDIFVSTNGGLGFNQVSLSGSTKGAAWRIEQQADFNEYFERDVPLTFKGYFSRKQAGFSSFSTARDTDLTEWGGELRYDFEQDKNGILASYSYEEDKGQHLEKIARAQYFTTFTEMFSGAFELQDRRENSYTTAGETKEVLAAVKVEATLFEGRDKAYVIQQATVHKSGDVSDNNKTTLGYQSQLTDSLNVGVEVFGSNRGAGGGLNATWDVNERASIYTKVINDVDSNAGRGITTTVGSKMKATSQVNLYTEKQFKSQSTERSTSDVYGVSYKPTSAQTIDVSYSTGQVNNRNRNTTTLVSDSGTKRDVYIVGYGYKDERYQLRSKIEYRWERSDSETIKQWVSTNRGKTIVSENWSWLAQFDIANTQGNTTAKNDIVSDYLEAAVGFAYRPQSINNLNLFGKLTYVRGVNPQDQIIANTSSSHRASYYNTEYDQKSWVWSLEGVYEWNQHWETAFKAAHRQGHLRYKGESEWFSSGASLYAARVNFKYADFEYQIEGRTLRTSLADDHKDGVVLSVYRNIGDNAKIGVGYNFTDYNDNLTRMNYDSHGWFINVVGSF